MEPLGIWIFRSPAEAAGVYHAAISPSRSVLMSFERESAVVFLWAVNASAVGWGFLRQLCDPR
jgi:hypothetical protein